MELVWVESEQCWAEVIQRNSSFCIVSFYKEGNFYEEIVEVDDIVSLKDMGIDYESDE